MKIFTTIVCETKNKVFRFNRYKYIDGERCYLCDPGTDKEILYSKTCGWTDPLPDGAELIDEFFLLERMKWFCVFGVRIIPFKWYTIQVDGADLDHHVFLGDSLNYDHVWIEKGLII